MDTDGESYPQMHTDDPQMAQINIDEEDKKLVFYTAASQAL